MVGKSLCSATETHGITSIQSQLLLVNGSRSGPISQPMTQRGWSSFAPTIRQATNRRRHGDSWRKRTGSMITLKGFTVQSVSNIERSASSWSASMRLAIPEARVGSPVHLDEADFPINPRRTEEQGYSAIWMSPSLRENSLNISRSSPICSIIEKKAQSLLIASVMKPSGKPHLMIVLIVFTAYAVSKIWRITAPWM